MGVELFSLVFTTVVLGYLIYKTYQLFLSSQKIQEYLIEYYQKKGYSDIEISELNTTERLKYGVPLISVFRIYSYYFGVFKNRIEYVRKVELVDKEEKECIKYVELTVRKKNITQLKEFDSYEF